jgi:hypothetical protein
MRNRLLLLGAWLILILSTTLIIFNICLNSDALLLAEVSRDLFSLGGAWQDWRLNPSPSYFPQMPLYFLAYKFFPLITDRSLFVTIIEALLIAASSIWLAKKIKRDLSVQAKVILILLVSFVSLTTVKANLLMYFSRINYHVSSLLFALLSLGCLLQYLTTSRKFYWVLLIIWAMLAIPSDMIYFVSFYLTAVVVLALGILLLHYKYDFPSLKRRFIFSLIALFIGFLLGKLLNFFLTYNAPLDASYAPESAGNSLAAIMHATYNSFRLDNKYTFILSLLIVVSLAYLVIILFKSLQGKYQQSANQQEIGYILAGFHFKSVEDCKLGFAGLFLIFLLPINMLCLIFAGHGDLSAYRYYIVPIALIFIQTIVNLDRSLKIERSRFISIFLFLMFILFSVIIVLTAIRSLKDGSLQSYRIGVHGGDNYIFSVATCLEQLDNNPVPLRSGVAEYWHARATTLFLKKHNYVLDVRGFGSLRPTFWMATKGPLLYPNKYQVYYNFVILIKDKALATVWNNFSPDVMGKVLPKGYISYPCPNDKTFEIWVYPGNELNNLMQANVSQFLFERNETKRANWLGMQLPSEIGQVVETARVASSKKDKTGFLTLGPSIDLEKGKYRISIYYSAEGVDARQPVGVWSIGKFDDPKQQIILAKGNFSTQTRNSVITTDVEILQNKLYNAEVRTWFSGQGNLIVSSILIEKL